MKTQRSKTHTPPARPGFTLVEVLIATVCFAIILAALNSAFYAALHLRAKTTKLVETIIPLNQAAAIIKRDLQGITAPGGTLAGPLTTEAQGVANTRHGQLEFYTTTGVIEDNQYWGETQKVDYYLKYPEFPDPNRGLDLVRGLTRNLLPVLTNDLAELPLLSGVESLEFYFYDGVDWQSSWDSTTAQTPLPQAIKLFIQFAAAADDQPAAGPLELIVPIFTQARTNQTANTGAGGQAGTAISGGQNTGPTAPASGTSGGNSQSNRGGR